MTVPDPWPQRAAADQFGVLLTWLERTLVEGGNAWHASDCLGEVARAADRLEQILDLADGAGEVIDWDTAVRDGAAARAGRGGLAGWLARQRGMPPAQAHGSRSARPTLPARCTLGRPPTGRGPRGR